MRLKEKRLAAALRDLQVEEGTLARLRSDYGKIMRSRFYALRTLWFSLKRMLGVSTDRDILAIWSGVNVGTSWSSQAPVAHAAALPAGISDAAIEAAVGALVDAWQALLQRCPQVEEPIVSVIIPAYNNAAVTVRCLQSVVDHWPGVPCQIVVVDDASTDATASILARLPGMDYLRNGLNAGFIRSCNRGATLARAQYLCFLNNDTVVTPGWLDELVKTAEDDPTVGAVGSKLIYPDGRLQEAGGIIWSDASGWNYGRNEDARDPRFNYVRDVDYCSGAVLLVRTALYRELGGFSELYIPAYYEDVDLAFALRERGYRLVYQPFSVVVHDEGTTSGVSLESGVKRYQVINGAKFADRWHGVLAKHVEHDPQRALFAARRLQRGKTIMMVDNYVPEFDKDAGSDRMFNLIQLFMKIGFDVIFVPSNYYRSEPYTSILQRMGVEVVYGTDATVTQVEAVRARLPLVDLAWVSRPDIGEKWLPILRERSDLPIIYDTVDLHYVRAKRELELKQPTRAEWDKWTHARDAELDVIRGADIAVVTTETEAANLAKEGVENLYVVPTMHRIVERAVDFGGTSGLLFIGGYQHPPNADAAIWLCEEIMPLVWAERPELKLTLLGSNPKQDVLGLRSERVQVPGYLPDVSSYFEAARVFVAPLRFGAGIKAKVGQAFGYGLPTITTPVGAEGFAITDGEHALIADDAPAFARAILRLYDDEPLWRRLSTGAKARIEPFTPDAIGARLPDVVKMATRRTAPAR